MGSRWIPNKHPRDSHGRFASKGGGSSAPSPLGAGIKVPGVGSVNARVSLRSATIQYGRSVPLIPGKATLYLGVLARVEKSGSNRSFLERRRDAAVEKLASKIPQGRAGQVAKDLLRNRKATIGGVSIGSTGGKRRTSSVRLGKAKAAGAGRKVRKPRQPRRRRAG